MARRQATKSRASLPQLGAALLGLAALALVVFLVVRGVGNQGAAASAGPTLPNPSPVAARPYTLTPVRAGRAEGWTLPKPLSGPRDVAVDPEGRVWVTEQDNGVVDSFEGNVLTRHRTDAFPNTGAFWLANGPGGMWFSGYPGGSVGRVLPDGTANSFNSLDPSSATLGIAQGPGGIMWVTDVNRGLLLRIQPNGVVDQLPVAPPKGVDKIPGPRIIVRGPDGNMWFTDPLTGSVGRVSTSGSPTITEFPIGAGSDPHSIAVGANGTLWATLGVQKSLAKIDPATGAATQVPVPAATGALDDLVVAPDGTLWVSQEAPYVLHVRPDGSLIGRVRLPGGASDADGLALAADGTLWAAAPDDDMIVAVQHASP
jgi:virginiamycin B lyase